LIPASLEETFQKSEGQIRASLLDVRRNLEQLDTTLAAAFDNATRKILYQHQKIRGKAARESMRRDARAEDDARYLSNLVFPRRSQQERAYCVLSFLAQHGLDFPERIFATIQPDCRDHQVWTA
jgi:hypothetical protein